MFSDSLGIVKSISVLLAVTKTGGDCCKLPLKTTEDEKEATAEEIRVDAAVASASSERDGIFTFTFGGKDVFASLLLWQEFSQTL